MANVQNRGGRPRRPSHDEHGHSMGYFRLKELETSSPEHMLNVISNSQSGFLSVLRREKLGPDWVSAVLHVSATVCQYCEKPPDAHSGFGYRQGQLQADGMASARLATYVNYVRTSGFLQAHCLPFVSGLLTERRPPRIRRDLKNMLALCRTMLLVMPNSMQQVLPVLSTIEMVTRMLRSNGCLDADYDLEVEAIVSDVKRLTESLVAMHSKRVSNAPEDEIQNDQGGRRPDGDFRQLSIFPDPEDLLRQTAKLPTNKQRGQYDNVDTYLDTHFRLLREDFIRPLREGIRDYLSSANKPEQRRRLINIRIYQNVHVRYPVCSADGIAYSVAFDASRLRHVRWENTKRLIYGALVCLSPDSFKTTYFATVFHRDVQQLAQGIVELRFQHGTREVAEIGIGQKLVMAESSAYFEAYRHVLEGLRDLNEQNLPFSRYLIRCERQIEPPLYLRRVLEPKYDLTQLKGDGKHVDVDVENGYDFDDNELNQVSVLDKKSWPPCEALGLDESQSRAVRLALTNEIAIVQGPPGTGKTYIGFKIVRALLANDAYWKDDEGGDDTESQSRPILLICYTNHALDQFLEGISTFLERGIVRVGGRSKSQILERFLIRELRKAIRERRDVPLEVHRNRLDAMSEQDRIRQEIERCVAEIEVTTKGFLHEDVLEEFMDERHLKQLSMGSARYGGKSVFSEWLGVDDGSAFRLYEEIQRGRNAADQITEERNPDDDEHVADEDAESVEQNRILHGIDDVESKPDENRQKRLIEKALKKLALEFSDLVYVSERGKKRLVDNEDQAKMVNLLALDDSMTVEEAADVLNIWRLKLGDRWRLYRRWLQEYHRSINEELRRLEDEYELTGRRLKDVKDREDMEIMRRARILGMTTTAAARYRRILHEVRPPICIVEEAAEVLEAHVTAALTAGCQHLILIGDHKQLRPNPTDYRIAENQKLKISLFERLVTNKLPYETLGRQHRMPPNISELLRHVYPGGLVDDPSVSDCSPIKGLTTNLFFVEHGHPEVEDLDLKSKLNKHEAHYVVALARHLILQGYRPDQITILTPYTGQLALIRRFLREKHQKMVRACAIDNFQGEENDIILVSLVRCNDEGKIGFLAVENRTCVLLSRAKKGLILIGDSVILSQTNDLWSKVIQTLRQAQRIGQVLTLRCVNHPKNTIQARCAADFDGAPEGGCLMMCQARLRCGHTCPKVCHAYDTTHSAYQCLKKCQRKCPRGHPCQKKCYQNCGECESMVAVIMPRCRHKQLIPCHEDVSSYVCQEPCQTRLACGHLCQKKCGEPHTRLCVIKTRRPLRCGHQVETQCFLSPDDVACPEPCSSYLSCEHKCGGTCAGCLEGRLHQPCKSPCKRILVCGHECQASCCQSCPPCTAKCENRCAHSICSERCGVPCTPCVEPCAWRCEHYQCSKRCFEPCDRPRCDKACRRTLPCGHECIGLCGEPCPSKCRVCDRDEVQELFFGDEDEDDARFVELEDCGHIIEVRALDKWMDATDDGNDDAGNNETVKLKRCPKCNTPIRRNLRYGKIIKATLRDIEQVKEKMLGKWLSGKDLKTKIGKSLNELKCRDPTAWEIMKERIKKKQDEIIPEEENVCIINIVNFLTSLGKLSNDVKTQITHVPNNELRCQRDSLLKDMKTLRGWLLKERTSMGQQEAKEAEMEKIRLRLLAKTIEYDIRIQETKPNINAVVELKFEKAKQLLNRKTPLTEVDKNDVEDALKELQRFVFRTGLGISDEERKQILTAMGLSRGHWYKCPNGHVYCIGECGGAMQEATCPECKATIGGTNHRLRDGNAVATEMDGAQHAAWSNEANVDHLIAAQFLDRDDADLVNW